MNITLTLDQESTDAVNLRVNEHNAANPDNQVDAAGYMAARNQAIVAGWVKADYDAAVARLGDLVADMTYAERLALIASIEQAAQ